MKISASQLKTYERCPRLWWFDRVRDMPRNPSTKNQVFGKVLHSVLERYLKGDALGRNPDGSPVDLYPEGWQTDETGQRIEPSEEELIQGMVEKAIEQGVIARQNGGQVERHFEVTLVPADPLIESILIQGYIDYLSPNCITDHKSVARMRYALSKEKLTSDIQMLVYAQVAGVNYVQHTVFDKSTGKVESRGPHYVSDEAKDLMWEKLQDYALHMKALRDLGLADEDFSRIPANYPSQACNDYGGCNYIYVCGGQLTPSKYRERKSLPVINPTNAAPPEAKAPQLTILHGVTVDKGSVGPTMTIADLLRTVVEAEGSTMEIYYAKNAFDRRDAVKQVIPKYLADLCPLVVTTRQDLDPDEKSLLAALCSYSTVELAARV